MATYKVPQDVEADDKLIGPFSFRQFIYLIIVALAGVAAWGLAQLFIGLVILPLPVIVLFGALALPLRKDQPMEIYMAAIVSYYLKPHKRLWDPEGVETLIEITAPKTYEENLTKGLSQNEAEQRLGYLADIVDSGGWAIRGTTAGPSAVVNNDVYLEAQSAVDVLDTNNSLGQSFNQMMAQSTIRAKEEAVERMKSAALAQTTPQMQTPTTPQMPPQATPQMPPQATPQMQTQTPISDATQAIPAPPPMQPTVATPLVDNQFITPEYNPYPTDIQQTVVQPLNDPSHMAEQNIPQSSVSTSDTPTPADIMRLVDNAEGLSVETLAHEAHRVQQKIEEESEEVVISLR